ncbi:hypothetical protein [Jannaschia sp. LMIT008]|uniref:hypothetical protein n=1 Tax=Jannaschia maritima TaxID=3032585 RepID=UPI002811E3FC|nr:hypothetical protein [Jannaschia sp. LMIT008]
MTRVHEFIDTLLLFGRPDPGTSERAIFAEAYRQELFATAMTLHNVGVIALGDAHSNPPERCDLCGSFWNDDAFFIDGQTSRISTIKRINPVSGTETYEEANTWADMCVDCYLREGRGLGWGIGQLYRRVLRSEDEAAWHLIAGGDPFGHSSPTEPRP